jgi:hypothetical protein
MSALSGIRLALATVLLAFSVTILAGLSPAGAAPTEEARLFDRSLLRVETGDATIDISAADYTAWQNLVTIAPDPGGAMQDVRVILDLDKATTGFADATGWDTETLQVSIARKVDGTNWRTCHNLITPSTAISADNATDLSLELTIGEVGPTEDVRVMVKVSAEGGADAVLPFVVYYRAAAGATITPVSP